MSDDEKKPIIKSPVVKSSMEILSELFSSFDAEPPLIIKKEKGETKKHKKSKKKHKHKDKKHKKKDKKRKRRDSSSSDSTGSETSETVIKKEDDPPKKHIKVEANIDLNKVKKENTENFEKKDKEKDEANSSSEKQPSSTDKKQKSDKIIIKNLKFSSIFEATVQQIKEKQDKDDPGTTSHGQKEKHRKHKHKKSDEKESRHKSQKEHSESDHPSSTSRKREHHESPDDRKHHHNHSHKRHKSKDSEKDKSKEYSTKEHKYKDDRRYRDDYRSDYKHRDYRDLDDDYYRDREKNKYKDSSFYRGYESDRTKDNNDKWFTKDRYRGYTEYEKGDRYYKEKSETKDSAHIDKKKLLEIARKNAIQMMKSGNLPGALALGRQAQEKVIAAIKAGGKTVSELIDFCKTLSKKEETGELSSVSEDGGSESESEKPFHHPFQIKDRPTSITMNIKNSVPLPIKSTQERTAELRMQFPVSSGQQHRITESEWVLVSPKKAEKSTKVTPAAPVSSTPSAPLAIEAPPPLPPPAVPATSSISAAAAVPGPQVFPLPPGEEAVDIGQIVSQRLSAIRKLQENPNDVQAISQMYKAQKEMQSWAVSKQQPGTFTGSTGAQILSQAELSSGYQAWARKDQLQTAAPVSGGMGMHLLQKMGWKPGEGLGKEKSGALEPLLLEVKLDKKGLVANEEQKKKQPKTQKVTVKTLEGKHPVSLLGEYASKRKLGAPQYSVCFECGPDHKKNFLFKVVLNGIEYKPNVASPNKKDAKAAAAAICLQQLGLLPS